MAGRYMNGHSLVPTAPPASGQPDLLAYPASSLAHFQQLIHSQTANPNGALSPQQLDQSSQALHHSAALQAAQQAALQQQWFVPKASASLAPPSDTINPGPAQSSREAPRQPPTLSPNRYHSSCPSLGCC